MRLTRRRRPRAGDLSGLDGFEAVEVTRAQLRPLSNLFPPVPGQRYFVDEREVDRAEYELASFRYQVLYGNSFIMRSTDVPAFPGDVVYRCIDPRRVHVAGAAWTIDESEGT